MIVKRGNSYGVRVRRQWIGTFPRLGKADGDPTVEARAAEAKAKATKHRSPVTCDGFAAVWLEQGCPTGRARKKKHSTLQGSRQALDGFSTDFQGVRLSDLDRDRAFRWALTNRWRVQYVRAMFNQARNRGLVDANPFERQGLPGGEGRRETPPLSEPEMLDVATAARQAHGDYGHVVEALVLVAAYTGMRQSELFALEWADLDLEALTVSVDRAVVDGVTDLPKSNRRRLIFLPPPAREALQAMAQRSAVLFGYPQDGLVFRARLGGGLSKTNFNDSRRGIWRLVRSEAKRPELDFHEMRHFAGHFFYVTLGFSDADTAYQLGHRDGGRLVRELYGHGDHGALERLRRGFDRPVELRDERERREDVG